MHLVNPGGGMVAGAHDGTLICVPLRNVARASALICMLKNTRKKAVTTRLQLFFRQLRHQVGEGVEELWQRVEARFSGESSESHDKDQQRP